MQAAVRDRSGAFTGDRWWWLALAGLALGAWLLRAFVVAPGPFHENLHGYAALGLDPFSVPGHPRLPSSYLALMSALGLRGDALIAANQVFSALVVVPLAVVAADLLGGRMPGLLAGAMAALHPLLARLGASEDPLAFYTLLLLLAVAGGRAARRRGSLFGLAGAACLVCLTAFVRAQTALAGLVFIVLAWEPSPPRRRLVVLGLYLLPVAAGVARLLSLDAPQPGALLAHGPSWLQRVWNVARPATIGGLELMRTPWLFPALALAGLAGLASAWGPGSGARVVRVLAPLLLLAAMADVWRLLPRVTLLEREYEVMRECLCSLPAQARYLPIDEGRASHLSSKRAWLRAERPLWRPLDVHSRFDDQWSGLRLPAVLLIDHRCSVDVTMGALPDRSFATAPTPWGPMSPACARALGAGAWTPVVRADLALEPDAGGDAPPIPVGCLVEAEYATP